MGVDGSKVQPPSAQAPFLSWDSNTVQTFLRFVKYENEGTFRMTKWRMLEFTGTEYLGEVTRLFALFEEPGETSVSSLQLAVALLLCNQSKSVGIDFKVLSCLEFFDWAGEGILSYYDLLLLLQSCSMALSRCVSEFPRDIDKGILDRLCRNAVPVENASKEEIANWAKSDDEVAALLAKLTPHDANPVETALEFSPPSRDPNALEDPDPSANVEEKEAVPSPQEEGAEDEEKGDEEAGEEGMGGEQGENDGAEEAAEGEGEDTEVAVEKEEEEEAEAPAPPPPPPVEKKVEAKKAPVEIPEPPISAPLSDRRRLVKSLEWYLEEIKMAFRAEGSRGEHSQRGTDSRAAVLEQCWNHSMGYLLPVIDTSWTAPVAAPPFGEKASQDALSTVLGDWIWVKRAALKEDALFDVAVVAKNFAAAPHPIVLQDAWEAASKRIMGLVSELGGGGDLSAIQARLQEEQNNAATRELEGLRTLHKLGPEFELPSKRLKRDLARIKGAITYLEFLQSRGQNFVEAEKLSGAAKALLGNLQAAVDALEPQRPQFDESTSAVLEARAFCSAVQAALETENPVKSLQESSKDLRIPEKEKNFGADARTTAEIHEDWEGRWRRSEGASIAVNALVRGGALNYELYLHQAKMIQSGVNQEEVMGHIAMLEGNPSSKASNSEVGLRPRKRIKVLESFHKELATAVQEFSMNPEPVAEEGAEEVEVDPVQEKMEAIKRAVLLEMTGGSEGGGTEANQASPSPPAGEGEGEGEEPAEGQEEGPEVGDSPGAPEVEEISGNVDSETLATYRCNRFEKRAYQITASVVKVLMKNGVRSGLSDWIDTTVEPKMAEEGDDPQLAKRKELKWQQVVEEVASEAAASASSVEGISAWVKRQLCQSYLTFHWPEFAGGSRFSGVFAPLEAQPAISLLEAPEDHGQPGSDCLGGVATGRHKTVAQAVGALRALEMVHEVAAVQEKVDFSLVHRCVELKVEAIFMEALAAQHMARAELKMQRMARESADARSSKNTHEQDGELVISPQEQVLGAAEELFEACSVVDLESVWNECIADPQLQVKKADLENMIQTLAAITERRNVSPDEKKASPGAPPLTPHMSSWWRTDENPMELLLSGDGVVCPRCFDLSRLTWEKLFSVVPDMPISAELLRAHAAALRVWIFAGHRRLAFDALLREIAGDTTFLKTMLLVQAKKSVLRFVENSWCRILRRQMVERFAEMRRRCFQKSLYYLGSLDAADVEFLEAEDVDAHVEEIRSDLQAALAASSSAAFAEAQGFLTGGVRTIVEDGLKQCVEQLQEDGSSPAAKAQALEYRPPPEADGAPLAQDMIERYTAECWGTLRALEQLKAFCNSYKQRDDNNNMFGNF